MAAAGPITKNSGGPRVKKLQKGVKKTLKDHGFDQWAKGVIVDGKPGPMTFKMARLAGSMQGLSKEQLKKIGDGRVLKHPELVLTHEKERSREMVARGKARDKHFDVIRHELKNPPVIEGVTTFDGLPCAGWIAEWLQKAREHGWGGVLVSGYRTPAHSEALCEGMCGAPSCPGTCAGTSSNHTCPPSFKCVKYEGACDLSEYDKAGQVFRVIGAPLINDLPADPVHYSKSGH